MPSVAWLRGLKSKEQLAKVTHKMFDIAKSLSGHSLAHGELVLYTIGYCWQNALGLEETTEPGAN